MSSTIVSIIVPIYNADLYLKNCLDSILNQTFTTFELILINDASTDNSALICEEYLLKDKRIKVFHQETNGGASVTRNIGLENARGKYILFIDADDIVLENHIESFFYTENIPSGTLVHAPHMINRNGVILNDNYSKPYIVTNFQLCESYQYSFLFAGPPWSKLMENKIIQDNNLKFKTDISVNEDHTFHLEYLLHINSYVNVGVRTLIYFDRPNSLSKKKFVYEEYERRLNYILPLTIKVIERFKISNIDIIANLYSTPINAIIFSLYSLYNYDTNKIKQKKERFKIIYRITKGNYSQILKNYWKPTNFKDIFIYILLNLKEALIIDFILLEIFKFKKNKCLLK